MFDKHLQESPNDARMTQQQRFRNVCPAFGNGDPSITLLSDACTKKLVESPSNNNALQRPHI